jgi:hypothetical protein
VKIVCQQPDSYVVSTSDGREFRRNRRAINVCRSQQSECPATPPTVNQRAPAADPSRRPRASFMFPSLSLSNSAANSAVRAPLVVPVPGPATNNVVAPVLSLSPTRPAVSAPAEPISRAVLPGITRKSRKPKEWPSCSRSSARLAAKNRRSVSHSPARSTASNPTSTLDPAQLVTVLLRKIPATPWTLFKILKRRWFQLTTTNLVRFPLLVCVVTSELLFVCFCVLLFFSFLLRFNFLIFALPIFLVMLKRKYVVSCHVGQSP